MSGEDNDQKIIDQPKSSNVPKSPAPWEASNHPLYLHHSDQPGAILVSQPLEEDNYTSWIQSMTMALMIKNKKGFVDGSLKRPTEEGDEQFQWERCNTLVKTWLLASMSKPISNSVIHIRDARGIWLELQERFSHVNTVQLFHIENEIHDCEQGANSVSAFFTKLKGLWDEREAVCEIPPCTCDAAQAIKTYMESQKTMKFLMGLNENFASVRSNAVAMDPLPTANKAYSMALRHEKQAEASRGKITPQPEAAAFVVRRGTRDQDFGEAKCEKCNKNNHLTKNCRAHLKCTFCNGRYHTFEYCRKRKALMEGGQSSSKGANVNAVNFPFSRQECKEILDMLNKNKAASVNQVGNVPHLEELSGKAFSFGSHQNKENVWILDSGASDHIIYNPSLLTSLTPVMNKYVRLPDGTSALVTHIGRVVFSP